MAGDCPTQQAGQSSPRRRPLARVHPVWWLNLAMIAVVIVFVGQVADATAISAPHFPWYVVAAGIAVSERWPVNLQFRRSAHAFSLTDIPVTLALIFASGHDLMVGVVAGSAVAMTLTRLPPIKLTFNVAQFALATAVGILVFRTITGPDPEFGARLWLGAFVATQLGGIVTICVLASAITLADGGLTSAELRQMFSLDAVVTVMNTSLALLAAVVVVAEPTAIPIIPIPIALAFIGYKAYVNERERSEKVEFLYEANRALSHSPEVADAIEGLLDRARDAFRADHADVILFGNDDAGPVRTRLGPGGERHAMERVDQRAAEALRDLASRGPVKLSAPLPAELASLSAGRDIRHAMAAVLQGRDRVVGTIVIANRVGINRGFEDEDVDLFQTLAANASAALQYDRLEQAVTELQELQHQLHHQAYHDPLTGLANRAMFTDRVAAALSEGGGGVAVLFIDLDDFKSVNDTLGHAVGDELLRAVGDRLAAAVRSNDLVARLGGDEFAILLRSADGDVEHVAVEMLDRMLGGFQLPIDVGDRLLPVNLSAGVATDRHSGASTADLLRDADVAMYEAKSGGKRRYALFTPEMRDSVMRRHTLKEELGVGIEREELLVQYQPIVDLASGATTAVEALVRWDHPTQGRIPPLEFVPLAENTGLIVSLTRLVLRTACRQAVSWATTGAPPLAVHVNFSGSELDDPDMADQVLEVLAETGLPPKHLVVEITESVLVRDAVSGSAQLRRLRDHGVRLALDDFGTGFSSLSYLRSLPLDMLKIAKEFTDGIAHDKEDATFVRLIIELAAMRGLDVVAEGIETRAQLDVLRALNCQLGQGYHFARPLNGDEACFTSDELRPNRRFIARPQMLMPQWTESLVAPQDRPG
jgi:diguanylate cyclase (GGDEF)-like protein